jgi:hypothetical protein
MAVPVDALTFVWSALMLVYIRTPEPPPLPVVERQHLLTEVVEGLRLVAGHPILRALGGASATGAVFGNFFRGAVQPVHGTRVRTQARVVGHSSGGGGADGGPVRGRRGGNGRAGFGVAPFGARMGGLLAEIGALATGWPVHTLWGVTTDRRIQAIESLAERALEVLVTHNEAVTCDDLACALGVSEADAWEIASTLQLRGYATVNEATRTATAT